MPYIEYWCNIMTCYCHPNIPISSQAYTSGAIIWNIWNKRLKTHGDTIEPGDLHRVKSSNIFAYIHMVPAHTHRTRLTRYEINEIWDSREATYEPWFERWLSLNYIGIGIWVKWLRWLQLFAGSWYFTTLENIIEDITIDAFQMIGIPRNAL